MVQIVNYSDLLDLDHAAAAVGTRYFENSTRFEAAAGRRYAYAEEAMRGVLEVVELHRDVLLILEHCVEYPAGEMTQLIGSGGWMHVQFRLSGSGAETLGPETDWFDTPDASCVITSYPTDTLVARNNVARDVQKTACLYMRPEMMERFFHVPSHAIPEDLRWIATGAEDRPRVHVAPLHDAANAAVHDMLACSFRAHARTAFLQAKSLELVAVLLQSIGETCDSRPGPRISSQDSARISAARNIMYERRRDPLTIDALAAQVGLNRSKLAAGFREMFGESVQVHWRNLRLSLARDMLRSEDLTVTQVAERLGYSEISSFTRAFTAHFGVSPKTIRSSAGPAAVALEKAAGQTLAGRSQ